MYWLSMYLMAITTTGTLCRILKYLDAGLLAWGVVLSVGGFLWFLWQEKYGELSPSTNELILKIGLLPVTLLSCLVITLR